MTRDRWRWARSTLQLSLVLILLVQLTEVSPQIIDCARIMMKVAKGLLKVYARCSKTFLNSIGGNKVEYQRRVHCVMKCVMGNIGILDEAEKVTNDTMQVFFDKFIPPDLHEIGHIMVEGCIEEYSPQMTNEVDDETCKPYGEFVACVQSIVSEAC